MAPGLAEALQLRPRGGGGGGGGGAHAGLAQVQVVDVRIVDHRSRQIGSRRRRRRRRRVADFGRRWRRTQVGDTGAASSARLMMALSLMMLDSPVEIQQEPQDGDACQGGQRSFCGAGLGHHSPTAVYHKPSWSFLPSFSAIPALYDCTVGAEKPGRGWLQFCVLQFPKLKSSSPLCLFQLQIFCLVVPASSPELPLPSLS